MTIEELARMTVDIGDDRLNHVITEEQHARRLVGVQAALDSHGWDWDQLDAACKQLQRTEQPQGQAPTGPAGDHSRPLDTLQPSAKTSAWLNAAVPDQNPALNQNASNPAPMTSPAPAVTQPGNTRPRA